MLHRPLTTPTATLDLTVARPHSERLTDAQRAVAAERLGGQQRTARRGLRASGTALGSRAQRRVLRASLARLPLPLWTDSGELGAAVVEV